jgi:hypothetical protein
VSAGDAVPRAISPHRLIAVWLSVALVIGSAAVAMGAAIHIVVLRSVGGLPPHVVAMFEEPTAFQQAASGRYLVFDRRGHTVYGVDVDRVTTRRLTQIGQEDGRLIQPSGFGMAPDGRFIVADVPRGQERIQTFEPAGLRSGGFLMPGRPSWTVTVGTLALNGIGSLHYTGDRLLISYPETGGLFTEFAPTGYPIRSIGQLRATGFEKDRDLHLAMNAGLPLADPTGGYFYVFLAGRPTFRKYDADGRLVFERHIEGRELDDYFETQPTTWPMRRVEDRELPFVMPVVRTAAVDRAGQLWVSLTLPYTLVYDAHGDKVRTVQFMGAGIVLPTSLFFTRTGRLLVTPGCYEFDPTSL